MSHLARGAASSSAPPPFVPRPAPSRVELLRDELRALARAAAARAREPPRASRDETEDVRAELPHARARRRQHGRAWRRRRRRDAAQRPGRARTARFDWLRVPLAELKAMRHALDCTINDVVLTVVTGAVRDYLIHRGVRPERHRPSASRRRSAFAARRRRASSATASRRGSSRCRSREADPRAAARRHPRRDRAAQGERQALGVETMMKIAEFTPSTLLTLGARSISGPINTIVTNVPGPAVPALLPGRARCSSCIRRCR